MKIRPLADRIVIKNVEAEETTKSGIKTALFYRFLIFYLYI